MKSQSLKDRFEKKELRKKFVNFLNSSSFNIQTLGDDIFSSWKETHGLNKPFKVENSRGEKKEGVLVSIFNIPSNDLLEKLINKEIHTFCRTRFYKKDGFDKTYRI